MGEVRGEKHSCDQINNPYMVIFRPGCRITKTMAKEKRDRMRNQLSTKYLTAFWEILMLCEIERLGKGNRRCILNNCRVLRCSPSTFCGRRVDLLCSRPKRAARSSDRPTFGIRSRSLVSETINHNIYYLEHVQKFIEYSAK